jgi:hypothetical protein
MRCYVPVFYSLTCTPQKKEIIAAQLKHETFIPPDSFSNQTIKGTREGKSARAPPCGAMASMRHPAVAPADLPKPHLAKETGAGSPAAGRAETPMAPAGHRMQDSAIGEATYVS